LTHLPYRAEELLSYLTGLAPVGQLVEVPREQVLQDLGQCFSTFYLHLNRLIDGGFVQRLGGGRAGSTGILVVTRRLEELSA